MEENYGHLEIRLAELIEKKGLNQRIISHEPPQSAICAEFQVSFLYNIIQNTSGNNDYKSYAQHSFCRLLRQFIFASY